jgi:hypothetical protein
MIPSDYSHPSVYPYKTTRPVTTATKTQNGQIAPCLVAAPVYCAGELVAFVGLIWTVAVVFPVTITVVMVYVKPLLVLVDVVVIVWGATV